MANSYVSKLGIIQRIYLMTERSSLKGSLVEQIHAPIDASTNDYNIHLIHKFNYNGSPCLLIGKDKFIPKDIAGSRILTLHTPRKMTNGQSADIGFHGQGSKLIYFQTEAEAQFLTYTNSAADYLYDVGDFGYINSEIKRLTIDIPDREQSLENLMDNMEDAKQNSVDDDLYHPTPKSPKSILNDEKFMNSALGQFIKEHQIKTFIILKNVNKIKNRELSDEKIGDADKEWKTLQNELSQLFSTNIENKELDIYFGSGIDNIPTKIPISNELCLTPLFWLHNITFEYMLSTEKHPEFDFWKNIGRWVHPSNYGKIKLTAEEASKDIYFEFFMNVAGDKRNISTRCNRLKITPNKWKSQMRITVARVKDEYIHASIGSKEELGGGAFVFIGNYLLNNIPQKMNAAITRNLPSGYNYRTRVDILDETLYTTHKDSGIELAPIKINSHIIRGSNTMKTIDDTVKLASKWFTYLESTNKLDKPYESLSSNDINEINKILDYETYKADNKQKSLEGSDKGCKIEQVIGDACMEAMKIYKDTPIVWSQGDTLISSRHELKNKGIDLMATIAKYALLIQIKSSDKFISKTELDKFNNTCIEYSTKNKDMQPIKLLIIKGPAKHIADNFNKLSQKSIICLTYPYMSNTTEFIEEVISDITDVMSSSIHRL